MLKTLAPGAIAWPRGAAIIGAGTMGLGVAESWIAAGVAVKLVDISPEQTRLARSRLEGRVRVLILTQWFDPEPVFKGLGFARKLAQRGATVIVATETILPNIALHPGHHIPLTPFNRAETMAAASILGDEAMHWAILRQALGENPVPAAFVG